MSQRIYSQEEYNRKAAWLPQLTYKINCLSNERKLKLARLNNSFSNSILDKLEGMYNILEEIYPSLVDIQIETRLDYTTTRSVYSNYFYVELYHILDHQIEPLPNTEVYYYHYERLNVYQYKDIHIIVTGVSFIIHFPEIKISNSKKHSHTIKDLFVKLPLIIGSDIKLNTNIQGLRTTFTVEEIMDGYRHSHLPKLDRPIKESSLTKWVVFCKGSGDISIVMANFNNESTLDNFEVFAHMLTSYVSWESLEGVPYKMISNISLKEKLFPDIRLAYLASIYSTIEREIINQSIIANLDWYYDQEKGKYLIVENAKLEMFLYHRCPLDYLLYKDSEGNYYKKLDNIPTDLDKYKHLSVLFKGEEKQITLIDELSVSQSYDDLYVHPKIKQYVKSNLEYHINKSFIKACSARRQGAISDTNGHTKQDQVSVQQSEQSGMVRSSIL